VGQIIYFLSVAPFDKGAGSFADWGIEKAAINIHYNLKVKINTIIM
jgi:hypothetical protein